MVTSCVASKCNNEQDRMKIPFHTFPFKRPEILKLWIQAIRRENWTPSKTSRICGEHFLPTDYIVKSGLTAKLLKPDAVPSVFPQMFSFPKHLSKPTVPSGQILQKALPTDIPTTIKVEFIDIDVPSTSPSTSTTSVNMLVDKATQTPPDNNAALRRKIKTLRQKLNRRNLKIGNMEEVIGYSYHKRKRSQ